MKYIDAEKLIAEIERLLKCTEPHRGEAVADGSRQTLYWIKDFITSLQQEQSEVDLEKEIDRWFGEQYMQNMVGLPSKPIVQIIARHFCEFGLNARKV